MEDGYMFGLTFVLGAITAVLILLFILNMIPIVVTFIKNNVKVIFICFILCLLSLPAILGVLGYND